MSSQHEDRLDRWLNTALRQHGNGEPRVGLEGRVIANLNSIQSRPSVRERRIWVLAASTAVAIIAISSVWFASQSKQNQQRNARNETVMHSLDTRGSAERTPMVSLRTQKESGHKGRRPTRQIVPNGWDPELASEPRLEQFPSPRPLSHEEGLLQAFIRNSPQQAVLVAQAQAERQKDLERLITRQSSKNDSEEKER